MAWSRQSRSDVQILMENERECAAVVQNLMEKERGGMYMGKMGSIWHFSRALPASIWGHCSQVLVFTSIRGTEKGV